MYDYRNIDSFLDRHCLSLSHCLGLIRLLAHGMAWHGAARHDDDDDDDCLSLIISLFGDADEL